MLLPDATVVIVVPKVEFIEVVNKEKVDVDGTQTLSNTLKESYWMI